MNTIPLAFEGKSDALRTIYSTLAANAERVSTAADGHTFGSVYLDNALHDAKVTPHQFAGYLSKLAELGVYTPVDGQHWGQIRLS